MTAGEDSIMTDHPWSIPLALADVPESGLHIDAEADAPARAAVARLAGVAGVPRLAAAFDVARWGNDGLHVAGRVTGAVEQTCVVTLEPLTNAIDEPVDLFFAPPVPQPAGKPAPKGRPDGAEDADEAVMHPDEADPPEDLVDGRTDLGRIAVEFLVLAVDPYPRKPGAVFAPPAPPAGGAGAGEDTSPFAALAALKKDGKVTTGRKGKTAKTAKKAQATKAAKAAKGAKAAKTAKTGKG